MYPDVLSTMVFVDLKKKICVNEQYVTHLYQPNIAQSYSNIELYCIDCITHI